MATAKHEKAQTKEAEKEKPKGSLAKGKGGTTDLAEKKEEGKVAVVGAAMYEKDAGGGMENTTADSFAIPFLMVMQALSPQVNEASGQAIEGAKAGMFFDNVSNRFYDGVKTGLQIVPCGYRRVFLRWGARKAGGGFKGELSPEMVADMRAKKQIVELEGKLYVPLENGGVDPDKCDLIGDHRNHYVLLIDPELSTWTQAVLSLTSTQVKKSKMLMSLLANHKIKGEGGRHFTPASWASIIKATTIGENNEKGAWFGVRFEHAGMVQDHALYEAGKAFNSMVTKGQVEVKYEQGVETEGAVPEDGKF
jgi:hypothetical protein